MPQSGGAATACFFMPWARSEPRASASGGAMWKISHHKRCGFAKQPPLPYATVRHGKRRLGDPAPVAARILTPDSGFVLSRALVRDPALGGRSFTVAALIQARLELFPVP